MAKGVFTTSLRTFVCVVWLVASLPLPTLAQPRVSVMPGQRQWVLGGWWRQAQGLPQDRVISLKQTRDGYLWVGTRAGVARFDGDRFVVWSGEVTSGPPEGEVFSLLELPDGALLLGVYGGGVTRFKDGHFTTFSTNDGLVDNYVRCLAVAADGAVWIGTDRGLSRYQGGRFTNFHGKDGLTDDSVRAIFATDNGILVGTDRGLQRVVRDRFERVVLSPEPQDVSVDAIVGDHAGRVWVATSVGLFCLADGQVTRFDPSNGLSSRAVRVVFEDSDGRIWAATNRGLDCAEPQSGMGFVFTSVISDADVTAITEDREHSIWVGYRGHGLARLQRSLFVVFDAAAGLGSSAASAVFQAHDGTMWAGVGTGLCAIRGTRVDTFGVESGLPDRAVSSLAEDSTGRIWVGTESGLFRSALPVRCPSRCEARFIPVVGHPALRTHVRVLRPDGPTIMLVGTNSDGVVAVPTAVSSGEMRVLVPGEIRAIVRESADRLWVGRRAGGLVLRSPAGLVTYSTRERLAHDNVQTLFLDREGTLWIGTRRGLSWMRDGRIVSVTSAQGLRENHVYGITDDRLGRLWLSSGSGVFTLAKHELFEYASGARSRVTSVVYGLEHGLPSTLCALSHDPVITTDANGYVWVATLGGVVSVDPGIRRANTVPPPIHVESVTVDGTVFQPGTPVETLHDKGDLLFRFAAPSFVAPDAITFRYRLEGFNSTWSEGRSTREPQFTNIQPGHYRFVVYARNGDGVESDASASVSVYLVPHFYQRTWFFVLLSVLIIGAGVGTGVGMHRVRVRRLKASERELARRVEDAVAHIKTLRGLLPVCAWCKRVRDDAGYWTQMEAYIRDHSEAAFSHGLCPDCLKANFPDDADGQDDNNAGG